jgi:pimeloyl-ACP methyl ester carboxylesterase
MIAEIDRCEEPVVLVGGWGGWGTSRSAAEAHPDPVALAIGVDSFAMGEGECIDDELAAVVGEIGLHEWSDLDDANLIDLTQELRSAFRAVAILEPAAAVRERRVLVDPRRHELASTMICCESTSDQVRQSFCEERPWLAEFGAMTDVTFVDLPTGHWPSSPSGRSWRRHCSRLLRRCFSHLSTARASRACRSALV